MKKLPSIVRSLFSTTLAAAFIAAASGCSATDDAYFEEEVELGEHEEALIGGSQAAAYHFRSTVGIGGECTAAKVGPKLFLTAAHCVSLPRPGRFETVPPDFPQNDGVKPKYLPGQSFVLNWGLNATDSQQSSVTVVRTSIHPSWWACPLCQNPTLSLDGAADIAVIEIAQLTPQIPEAVVDLDPVAPGQQVAKVGWGCEDHTNHAPGSIPLGRYKTADAWVVAAAQIQLPDPVYTSDEIAKVGASYLITEGKDKNSARASLCLGDSGGPLYLPNNTERRIVGVNSNYNFRPGSNGVSWTDWHTKTANNAPLGVARWLINQGVSTVGTPPASECTCPSGCNAVQPASAPFTSNGVVNGCYYFSDLGSSVNSHSMQQVNLNGQNITNQWRGSSSYPALRDHGYYLYLSGQLGWSWAQVQP